MILQLGGIYVNHDILYFRLFLKNKSNISYAIDNISFTIKDKQKSKRTATQELSLTPLYSLNGLSNVKSNSTVICVIALSKFTLPDSKRLSIQVLEKDGSRNLSLL